MITTTNAAATKVSKTLINFAKEWTQGRERFLTDRPEATNVLVGAWNAAHDQPKSYWIEHITEGATCLADRQKVEFKGTYEQAVDEAHRVWRALTRKQSVTVHGDNWCLHFWHMIGHDGRAYDRNNYSGVIFSHEA